VKKLWNQRWWPGNGCDGKLMTKKKINNDNSGEIGAGGNIFT